MKRIFYQVAVALTVFAVQSVWAQIPARYNAGDMAVINAIIENNGLKWTKAEPADGNFTPEDWTGIKWSDDDSNRRIVQLIIQSASFGEDIEEGTLTGTLDVSKLTDLQYLDCSNNRLTSLHVFGMTRLQTLRCNDNNLTSLNLSGCTGLRILNCNDNRLSSLDVTELKALRELYCGWNRLDALDVSGLTDLFSMVCSENNLGSLSLSGCAGLQALNCRANNLTALNVSGYTRLNELNCMDNQLTSLDLSECVNLVTLYCASNRLTSLILLNCNDLEIIWCQNNRLTWLDLTEFDNLTQFFGDSQTYHITLTGNDNDYTARIAFGNGVSFENTALMYSNDILKSANNKAQTSDFSSPTGQSDYTLSGTLFLDYGDD